MNVTTARARAQVHPVMPSLALHGVALVTTSHTLSSAGLAPQRLSVWDERARKMGSPPSAR